MGSPIEEYDRELAKDIRSLESYIARDEECAKAEFQRYGCPKETAERIAADKRKDGRHISFDYPACLGSDEMLIALKELQELSESMPFRMYLTLPNILNSGWEADWRSIEVITGNGSFQFNIAGLDDAEQERFLEYMVALFDVYRHAHSWGVSHCYPSLSLLKLIGEMLAQRQG